MNIFKIFNTHDDYNNYMSSNNKKLPNISYCEDNDEVHYNMEPPPITVYYDVQDISSPTLIFTGNSQNSSKNIDSYEIDDKVLIKNTSSDTYIYYQFDTVGEHYIRYWFVLPYNSDKPTTICPNQPPSFNYVNTIKKVYIPRDYYTSIGSSAFINCTGLTNINIPNSITSIGNQAFYNCSSLTSITIPNSVTSISNAFNTAITTVTIDNNYIVSYERTTDSIASIFGNQVQNYILGDSVTYIGRNTFQSLLNVKSIIIGNNVTSIGHMVFQGCTGLTSITIPNNVTSIGNNIFYGCSKLSFVVIGSGLTSINYGTFSGCTAITSVGPVGSNSSVEIPNNITSIGSYAFESCINLTKVTIPSSITTLDSYIFSSCKKLTSITIDSDALVSKNYTTSNTINGSIGTSYLAKYIIGSNVTSIGNYAFYSNYYLNELEVGSNVTSIGDSAFKNCSSLGIIKCLAMIAPTIESNTFQYIKSSGTLTVPSGSTGYDTWLGYLGNSWTKVEI